MKPVVRASVTITGSAEVIPGCPQVLLLADRSLLLCTAPAAPHYDDVIMGAIASQITSLTIVYSTVYSDADQRKYQSSASLAFVRGIHRGPVNSPHKWPVTRKMSPFGDVIMREFYQTLQIHATHGESCIVYKLGRHSFPVLRIGSKGT